MLKEHGKVLLGVHTVVVLCWWKELYQWPFGPRTTVLRVSVPCNVWSVHFTDQNSEQSVISSQLFMALRNVLDDSSSQLRRVCVCTCTCMCCLPPVQVWKFSPTLYLNNSRTMKKYILLKILPAFVELRAVYFVESGGFFNAVGFRKSIYQCIKRFELRCWMWEKQKDAGICL